jgi:hypothetical protein
MTDTEEFSSYYLNDTIPTKLKSEPAHRTVGWSLELHSGGWRTLSEDEIETILWDVGGPVFKVLRDRFIYDVEYGRSGRYREADALGELYEAARRITDPGGLTAASITREDQAFLAGLYARTYPMFEAMLRDDGDPGADLDAAAQYPPGTVTWHRAP